VVVTGGPLEGLEIIMIRLSKSCIGKSEIRAVAEVLEKEFLGMGKKVQEFEGLLSDFFGRQAVCVVNGTAALHLACQAIGLKTGDEVLVQSLTFVASCQAIAATGARPVFCEVKPDTITIDLADAEKRITENTRAIMPVHYSGGVGDLDGVYKFAEKHKLRVIEDAAHAFGTLYNEKKTGSFGDISCFSFDGIKNITSGEGGCIVTDDPEILEKVKDARLLGVVKDTEKRFSGERSWQFEVTEQGWRYHMSDLMAAIGIEQFKKFPEMAKKRKMLAALYADLLKDNKNVRLLNLDHDQVVPHIFVVKLNGKIKHKVAEVLKEKGIQTGAHYQPSHWLKYFQQVGCELPVTDAIYDELLTLPLHPDLEPADVRYIVDSLNSVL